MIDIEIDKMIEVKRRGWTYNPETGLVLSSTGNEPKVRQTIINKKTGEEYKYIRCSISINNKVNGFKAHRFAYWYMTGELPAQVDHILHCDDAVWMNRFENLRASDNQKNQFNRPDVKGYFWSKSNNKWRAKITIDNRVIYLGSFKTEQEARNAYLSAKKIYHI